MSARSKSAVFNAKLLIVEDDRPLAELLEYRFEHEGYRVRTTANGDQALAMVREDIPDLIILDWMIQGLTGIEVLRYLRRRSATSDLPIVMLTARQSEDDRLCGLESGADDYVVKPFSPRELVARVAAVLRRFQPAPPAEIINIGDLRLDETDRRIEFAGHEISLPPTLYRILAFLMRHPDRVFSRTQIVDAIWGNPSEVLERNVDVHIRRLRAAIAQVHTGDPIRTVRLAGYALDPVRCGAKARRTGSK